MYNTTEMIFYLYLLIAGVHHLGNTFCSHSGSVVFLTSHAAHCGSLVACGTGSAVEPLVHMTLHLSHLSRCVGGVTNSVDLGWPSWSSLRRGEKSSEKEFFGNKF